MNFPRVNPYPDRADGYGLYSHSVIHRGETELWVVCPQHPTSTYAIAAHNESPDGFPSELRQRTHCRSVLLQCCFSPRPRFPRHLAPVLPQLLTSPRPTRKNYIHKSDTVKHKKNHDLGKCPLPIAVKTLKSMKPKTFVMRMNGEKFFR